MKIFFLLIFFSFSIFSQDESILKLFPGKWKMISDKVEYYEEWEISVENELTGIGFSIEDGDTLLSERLYLKKFDDVWAYIAHPSSQNITLFALSAFSNNKFVFENKEHDFPQKIIYEFHKDGKLTAAIEGTVNGEIKRREFEYLIVED